MNFTREPIIETIIAPKEGFKLLVRSSKGHTTGDEFLVDAVEVVSFGNALFFRSLERPRAFLVPVTDYEVLEVKEARLALKGGPTEKNIKIGGGREGTLRPREEEVTTTVEETSTEEGTEEVAHERQPHGMPSEKEKIAIVDAVVVVTIEERDNTLLKDILQKGCL